MLRVQKEPDVSLFRCRQEPQAAGRSIQSMHRHDYVRHTVDCLEEAEAALHLAVRRGQVTPGDEPALMRRIEDLARVVERVTRTNEPADRKSTRLNSSH